jgi:16S rRNA (uracil1498-N3)-methyltransferase
MMPQFYVDQKFELGEEVEIRGSDAKHISTVLRLKENDWIVLSDGKGNNFRAKIISSTGRCVKANVDEKLEKPKVAPPPVLAFSIIKHDRTETIIQKAVELGIRRLIPFHSERTVPRLVDEVGSRKMDRWQTIAKEAAKQSGLGFVPVVGAPISFKDLVTSSNEYKTRIMFWEGEKKRDLNAIREELSNETKKLILIGPEGGFSSQEVELAKSNGFLTVSLGSQILRVETAAIAALSICQYESGGFSVKGSS